MRILFVIDSMAKGGAEMQFLKTLASLDSDKFEAFVVLSREAGEYRNRLAALPIVQEIIILSGGKRSSVFSLIEKVFQFGGIVKAVQPSIIHSWLWYSNFLCGLAYQFRLSSGKRLIVSQRNDYHAKYGRLRFWLTEQVIYRHADTILVNFRRMGDALRKRYPERRIHSIQNIVESPHPTVHSSSQKEAASKNNHTPDRLTRHIVSVGRLTQQKGHTYLIQALNILNTKLGVSDFTATIVGNGEMQDELRHLADSYQLSDQIKLPGFCDDLVPTLSNADLFVLPSRLGRLLLKAAK